MSAFFVGFDHISALLSYANDKGISLPSGKAGDDYWSRSTDTDEMERLGRVLVAENIRSLLARYPQDVADDHAEVNSYRLIWDGFAKRMSMSKHDAAVKVMKMCDCYDYQACETRDYEESHAYKIVNTIRHAATRDVLGYSDAGWQYTKASKVPARPGDMAAIYAEETGVDYSTALVHCNMD